MPPKRRRRPPKGEKPSAHLTPEEAEHLRQRELLETSLADVGMSVRNVNTLEKEGILTLGDLVNLTKAQLVGNSTQEGVLNFGERAFAEAVKILTDLGIYPKAWGVKPPKGAKRGKKG
jgi:DNA-directed RNA polymerase alpha subunit